jgi:hypothetical protein
MNSDVDALVVENNEDVRQFQGRADSHPALIRFQGGDMNATAANVLVSNQGDARELPRRLKLAWPTRSGLWPKSRRRRGRGGGCGGVDPRAPR